MIGDWVPFPDPGGPASRFSSYILLGLLNLFKKCINKWILKAWRFKFNDWDEYGE